VNVELLRTFLSVVELGSISAAAVRGGAQVSTVSRRVAELEREVGVELLVRGGRGTRLTSAGDAFAERARYVLLELEHAVAIARGEASVGPAHLRVSVPTELALRLLPEAVAETSRRFPDVTFHVHSDARRVSLVEENYDAAVRLGKPAPSELIARSIGNVALIVVCHPSQRVAHASELAARRFVSPHAARRTVSARWGRREVSCGAADDPTVGTFTEAAEMATRVPLAAVLPSYTAVPYLRDGRLVPLSPSIRVSPVPLHLLLPRRHRSNPALAELGARLQSGLRTIQLELEDCTRSLGRRRSD
jgi:DNA-binding transcriptional LysR family regulator